MREPAFLAQLGYPMLCEGRLLRCGISAVGANGKPQRHGVGVTLTVNGDPDARFGVVIGKGVYSGWSSYVEPLEFSTGTRLGLVTSFDSPSTKNAVVNMLIEVISL